MKNASSIEFEKKLALAWHLFSSEGHVVASDYFDNALKYAQAYGHDINSGWSKISNIPNYLVVQVKTPKTLYFPIPKCASTTVLSWLMELKLTRKKHPGIKQLVRSKIEPHGYFGYIPQFDLDQFGSYEWFTVVRDPVERFCSFFYHYKSELAKGAIQSDRKYTEHINSIDSFIDYFCHNPITDLYIYQHTISQSKVIGEVYPSMDNIFLTNHLEELRIYLEDRFSIGIPARQHNTSKKDIAKPNKGSINLLRDYYEKDYSLLSKLYK